MFPPIVPHLLRGDLTQMPNFVQHMPCKLKRQAFFSAQDTQSEGNVHNRPETHNLRPRAVAGIWQQSAYEPICTLFHTGQQWLTSTDEGFLHTHLPMFWEGGVSPQSNITAASDYVYVHAIIRLRPASQSQPMHEQHQSLHS